MKKALQIVGMIVLIAIILLALGTAISVPPSWKNFAGLGIVLLAIGIQRWWERHHQATADTVAMPPVQLVNSDLPADYDFDLPAFVQR